MQKDISSSANTQPAVPFITEDYHLIVGDQDFVEYQRAAAKRRWIIGLAITAALLAIISISVAVIPLFLQAHLESSSSSHAPSHSESVHSAPSGHGVHSLTESIIPSPISIKAVYGE